MADSKISQQLAMFNNGQKFNKLFIDGLILHDILLAHASMQAGQTAMQRKHSYWNPMNEAW
jgi:hypothetical protein